MKNFKKGEIVTISPVMVIPKSELSEVGETTETIVQNYCIASSNVSSIALFPFGLSAVANHARPEKANMAMDWFWWNEEERQAKMDATPEKLSGSPFAQLDLAFKAIKDIAVGTELTYDYGHEWADKWAKHLAALNQWHLNSAWIRHAETHHEPPYKQIRGSDKPRFLNFIGAPEGLFRPEWHDKPADPIVPPGDSKDDVTQPVESTEPSALAGYLIEPVAHVADLELSQSRFLSHEAANFTGGAASDDVTYELEVDSFGATVSSISRSS